MNDNDDLRLLLEIWLSETENDEMERLLERLKVDDAFRSLFIDEVIMMGKIKVVNSSEPKFSYLQEILDSHPSSNDDKDYQDQVIASLKKQQKDKKVIKFFLAIAAIVAFSFLLPKSITTNTSKKTAAKQVTKEDIKPTFAYISSQKDASWKSPNRNLQKNIFKEKIHLLSGSARIDFDYGASLIISGETIIDVREAGEIFLEKGNINCEVSELGHGFRILTEDSEITDLGTAFQVEAGETTKVHVLDGEIEIKPKDSQELKKFYEKQAVTVAKSGFQDLVYSPDVTQTVENFEISQEENREQKLKVWRTTNTSLNRDPDTLFHLVKSKRPVRNSRRDVKGNGVKAFHVIGCSNGRGRWNENGSLDYTKKYDRTMARLQSEDQKNLTLSSWVKVDKLKLGETAIACFEVSGRWIKNVRNTNQKIQNFKPDAFHCLRWHIGGKGHLKLHIAYYGDVHKAGSLKNFQYTSPSVFDEKIEGEWIFLSASIDSNKRVIKHYMNGTLVAELPYKADHYFNLEFLELGNLSHPNKEAKVPDFRLRGSIDQMLVSKRVYTDSEIADLYHKSKPE
ncbi:MAG: FecR domain-containing protein [Lentisphaeraceae bacterium]|nr:FecR domain-containing protein [Lentisphaeraceae bacterium]